ncbi:MAG: DUF45 domain-containing protein [Clostridia bacterium]|nr:DUF45 domain-containing protein [Clostridia bacterium]MDD4047377.1 DUF45 domain-containing protein [Clostridia bacterium]
MEIKKLTQEEVNGTLWRACDTFRGKIDSAIYKDYVLVMLFIKWLNPHKTGKSRCFKEVQPECLIEKVYLSGETFKYLGNQYRLKVIEIGNGIKNEFEIEDENEVGECVKYFRGYIYLYVKDRNNYKRKQKLIHDWYRGKAHQKFWESLERVYPYVERYGVGKPDIQIRTMKARWGSCLLNDKSILLNSELIKAPKLCIDYVVLHELIHFKHENHDSNFYDFMTSLMPDWKQRKEILDEEVVREL